MQTDVVLVCARLPSPLSCNAYTWSSHMDLLVVSQSAFHPVALAWLSLYLGPHFSRSSMTDP